MKVRTIPFGLLLLYLLSGGGHRAQAADLERGRDVFATECAECHSVREGKNKKGPTLFAIVGRRAGSVAEAAYSDPLKASGITWTPERIDAYVANPRKVVPGGKMKYDGLAGSAERGDLLAYLETLK
ncbi:cytochrome c family protein [Zoogloea sp.]|uniref:c-type cytochrome n=1 Tax=Zoogloea sp. TaxID=49181 RepID=UPI0035AEF320